jgi:pimeloyl-ACP methyl ester carboxylesterase
MDEPLDYGLLDGISSAIFYPRRHWSPPPRGAVDLRFPAGDGVELSARLYPSDPGSPHILFFHGNGELACEYDELAPDYRAAGAGLLVADFRGYGASTGAPSFSTLIADARACFRGARDALRARGYGGPLLVKGRSLGTHSALEVAARFPGELAGLIVESGASALERLAQLAGVDPRSAPLERLIAGHRAKVRSICLPLLMLHGEADELVPLSAARAREAQRPAVAGPATLLRRAAALHRRLHVPLSRPRAPGAPAPL